MYLSACCQGVTTLLHLLSACCLTITFSTVPDKPFKVVWNHPEACEKKGTHIALAEHGIIHNSDRRFIGDKIQTLHQFGEWPEISQTNSTMINDNEQQLNDTTLEDLKRNFVSNFTGLGVINWQGWEAIFQANSEVDRNKSIENARQMNPDLNESAVLQLAEQHWEELAREVMSKKLALAQEMMPNGHWGYSKYPNIWNKPNTENTVRLNNRLEWLWKQSTGLYPSRYMYNPNKNSDDLKPLVSDTVSEALRVKRKFSPPNTVLYLYIVCHYNTFNFYTLNHLKLFIGLPADMGVDGVVIWGTSAMYRNPETCSKIQDYVRDVLGPYVQNLTRVLADCSTALCAGRGRCIHNAHDVYMKKVMLSARCTSRDSRFRDYHCRCYNSSDGDCCHGSLATSDKPTLYNTASLPSGIDRHPSTEYHTQSHHTLSNGHTQKERKGAGDDSGHTHKEGKGAGDDSGHTHKAGGTGDSSGHGHKVERREQPNVVPDKESIDSNILFVALPPLLALSLTAICTVVYIVCGPSKKKRSSENKLQRELDIDSSSSSSDLYRKEYRTARTMLQVLTSSNEHFTSSAMLQTLSSSGVSPYRDTVLQSLSSSGKSTTRNTVHL